MEEDDKMVNIKDILNIFPQNIKYVVESIKNYENLQEIRVKVNKPLIIYIGNDEITHQYIITADDMKNFVQRMSSYSMYAFGEEIKQGYITIKGGHRVGICGSCIIENSKIKTIKDIASLNIRVSKEVIGCSNDIIPFLISDNCIINTIIISPPKCGKTTILRDIAKNLSNGILESGFVGKKICVIDERSEIAACYYGVPQMQVGTRTDVLDNCPKCEGIMMAIRSMSPDIIICDEIGTQRDMESILMAMNSGVSLITSIHGLGIEDLYNRSVFNELIENKVFQRAVVLSGINGAGTIEYIYDFKTEEKIWRK
jgi:stage III sporulation protein AA